MKKEPEINGTLKEGEAHPAAAFALEYIHRLGIGELNKWMEALSSTAIEGNRLAEICACTLARVMEGKSVSDRYVLGLAWFLKMEIK